MGACYHGIRARSGPAARWQFKDCVAAETGRFGPLIVPTNRRDTRVYRRTLFIISFAFALAAFAPAATQSKVYSFPLTVQSTTYWP